MFETWLRSDLKKPLTVECLEGTFFSGDNEGNLVGVEVFDDGSPASLSGGVTGYVVRADDVTVTISGTLTDNKAYIVLPSSAYTVPGFASIVIKVSTVTVGACVVYVYRSTTDSMFDPGHVVPSLEELLAKIADCEAATAAAMEVANLTVSAEPSGSDFPTATLSEEGAGDQVHKHITFGLVKGEQGEVGATPSFSIGTVEGGAQAAATITGTAEEPVLNLTLPKGDTGSTGATGATPNLTIGTVETGGSGSSASATITGTAEDPVLNMVIPKGDTGDTGATGAVPDISVGTVTTLQPGQNATVTRRSGSPDTAPVFDFGIPKGDPGQAGDVYGNTIEMSSTDSTLVSDAINSKVAGNQGSANAGKVLGVASDGTVTPVSAASGDPFTGATASTDGAKGLVPAPLAGQQTLVLTGGGGWQESPGAKVYVVELQVTNTSGAYTATVQDENITASMKAVELEVTRPYVFGDVITVTPANGSYTVSCANVSGTDTIKISFLKVIADPTAITSTEFDILNNRITAIENTEALYSVTIQTSDWSASPYTYTWSNSDVTADCSVEIGFLDGAEDCDIDFLEWEKATGSITFSVETLPSVALPIVIKLTNARAKYVENLTADMVATDAVTGASNVDEALTALNTKTSVSTGAELQTGVTSYQTYYLQKQGKLVTIDMYLQKTLTLNSWNNLAALPTGYAPITNTYFGAVNDMKGSVIVGIVSNQGLVRIWPSSDNSTAVSTNIIVHVSYFTA